MRKKKIQLNRQWLFSLLAGLMLMLVFVRYALQINYPRAILLGLSAIMSFIGNPSQILALCMFSIPLTTAYHYVYAIFIAIIVYILKYERRIRFNVTIIPIFLLIIWELLHGIGGEFALKDLVRMFLPYLLCGLLRWQDEQSVKNLDYAYIVRAYAISTCAVCIILIFGVIKTVNYDLSKAFVGIQRLGKVEENSQQIGIIVNPNSLGIMCVMAASGLLQLITTGRRKKQDIYLLVVLLISGMLTVSRTYLALLLIMVLLFGFAARHSFGERMRFLIIIVIITGLVIGLAYWIFPGVFDAFSDRFDVDDLSSGRMTLFLKYNDYLLSRPEIMMFGIGLTNFPVRISLMTNFFNVPHNGIQEIILAWGIIGLAIFLAFCACFLIKEKKIWGRKTLINYIPFILWFAKIQAGQMVTSDYTMLLLAYCCLSVTYDFADKN